MKAANNRGLMQKHQHVNLTPNNWSVSHLTSFSLPLPSHHFSNKLEIVSTDGASGLE